MTYQYSTRSELTQEQSARSGGYTNVFGYDPAANPTTFKSIPHVFNTDNQDTANVFDNNGNPTLYRGTAMAYDPEKHLTQAGALLTAGYRGDGLRAWKQGTGARTYFLYDGAVPVIEMDGSGNVTATNTFGFNGLVSRHTASGSTFYCFDHQGSVA